MNELRLVKRLRAESFLTWELLLGGPLLAIVLQRKVSGIYRFLGKVWVFRKISIIGDL